MNAHPDDLHQSATPPMRRSPKRLVILLGNKLIGLDSILPVAMELKAETPDLKVTFLFVNAQTVPVVQRNYVLWRALKETGDVAALSSGSGTWIGRFKAGLRLLSIAARLAASPSLLLSHSDFGRFPFNILAFAARRGGGAACIYCKPAFPGNAALNYVQGLKTTGRDMRWRDPGDAFLAYHPSQIQDYASYTDAPAALLGTPRDLPAWRQFLDRIRADTGVRDEAGEDLTALPGPVFLVFYPGPAVIPHQVDDVRESLLLFLNILTEEAPGAAVVIKPHPICDLDLLRRDITRFPSLRIHVSHAHPQLLARFATVTVVPNATNAMFDCFLEGVPVIETSRYRPDVLALGETLIPNAGRIGCPDEASLRAAVRMTVKEPERLPQPDKRELGWPKPARLAGVLWPA